MSKKKSYKIAIISISLALFGVLGFLSMAAAMEPETVVSGVTVLDCDLSGLTREAGEERLLKLEQELITSVPLVLRYGVQSWQIKPQKIGLVLDREKILNEAMAVGRQGSVLDRLKEWHQARVEGRQLPVYVKMNEDQLESELKSIAEKIAVPPRDAQLMIHPDETVEVIPSQEGMSVDLSKVQLDIEEIFKNYEATPEIHLSLIKARPKKTTEDVLNMGVNSLLATYTTNFNPSDTGRSYNIAVAADALDGLFIAPGDVFSFNQTVGPRSTEAGYKNAKVIINNEFVEGLGGGVCQVSSTLYNTVLLANLEIIDRSNHSLPVLYVPPGRDATVFFDYIDFRFKNSTSKYIYLKSFVNRGRLTLKIYGDSSFRREVMIRNKVLESIPFKTIYKKDPSLKKGETKVKQKGISGMKVASERVVYEQGRYRIERLPFSYYRPIDQIILMGPGAVKTSEVRPTEPDAQQPETEPVPNDPQQQEITVPNQEDPNSVLPDAGGIVAPEQEIE